MNENHFYPFAKVHMLSIEINHIIFFLFSLLVYNLSTSHLVYVVKYLTLEWAKNYIKICINKNIYLNYMNIMLIYL